MKNLTETTKEFIYMALFALFMAFLLISIYSFADDTRENRGIEIKIQKAKTEPERIRKTVIYTAEISKSDLQEVNILHESDNLIYKSPFKIVFFSDTFRSYDVAYIYTIK